MSTPAGQTMRNFPLPRAARCAITAMGFDGLAETHLVPDEGAFLAEGIFGAEGLVPAQVTLSREVSSGKDSTAWMSSSLRAPWAAVSGRLAPVMFSTAV